MRYHILTCMLCAVLPACSSGDRPEFSSESSALSDADELARRKAFEEAVVGHKLRGDGVDVSVEPDGVLVGTYLGKPFVGSWAFRRGIFCASMTAADIRKADDTRCFRAVTSGRTLILHPV